MSRLVRSVRPAFSLGALRVILAATAALTVLLVGCAGGNGSGDATAARSATASPLPSATLSPASVPGSEETPFNQAEGFGITRAASKSASVSVSGGLITVNGKAKRLCGYGDYGILAEAGFDYGGFFAKCESRGVNLVRVFAVYHWTKSATPFARSGTKYQIEVQDGNYFTRLRNFVDAANQRGIVVQVCILDGSGVTESSQWSWAYSPYNKAQNVNGYIDKPGNVPGVFGNTGSRCWNNVNGPLIDRVASALNGCSNVIFETINEPVSHGLGDGYFNQTVVDRLYAALRKPGRTGSTVISLNADGNWIKNWANQNPKIDIISAHVSAEGVAGWLGSVGKPLIISNDGDRSQQTQAQGGDAPEARKARIRSYLATALDNQTVGRYAVEILDKGLNGSTWKTVDYTPQSGFANDDLMKLIGSFVK